MTPKTDHADASNGGRVPTGHHHHHLRWHGCGGSFSNIIYHGSDSTGRPRNYVLGDLMRFPAPRIEHWEYGKLPFTDWNIMKFLVLISIIIIDKSNPSCRSKRIKICNQNFKIGPSNDLWLPRDVMKWDFWMPTPHSVDSFRQKSPGSSGKRLFLWEVYSPLDMYD